MHVVRRIVTYTFVDANVSDDLLPVPVTGVVVIVVAGLNVKVVAVAINLGRMIIVMSGVVIISRGVPERTLRRVEAAVSAPAISSINRTAVSPAVSVVSSVILIPTTMPMPGLRRGGSDADDDNAGQCDFQES